MSYILDALKKAERERGIKQVPTLMAEHEPGTKHRKSFWVILGALVICAGAVTLSLVLLHNTKNPPPPSFTAGEYRQGTKGLEAKQSGAAVSSTMPAAMSELSNKKSGGSAPSAPRSIVPPAPVIFLRQKSSTAHASSRWPNIWLRPAGRTRRTEKTILHLK